MTPVNSNVSGDQITKRLNVIKELNTDNVNVGRDIKKSVDVLYDRIGSIKTEMRIVTCMLLLVLIILIFFVLIIVLYIYCFLLDGLKVSFCQTSFSEVNPLFAQHFFFDQFKKL